MNNEEERSNDEKPSNPSADSDQTQQRKLQAMEIRSDVWFLAATPVEERSNDAKPSNPSTDFDQTQETKASSDGNQIGRVVSCHHSSGGEEHIGVKSGFDLFWI